MELVGRDITTISYIQSESEFNTAKFKGLWQRIVAFITGRDITLRCLDDEIGDLRLAQFHNLGLQDIPIDKIVGTFDRCHDFTRYFAPLANNQIEKDRWRNIYTLAITGVGWPPVELYKVGSSYFVRDGHHRISVSTYLGWRTIQAYVTELPTPKGDQVCV